MADYKIKMLSSGSLWMPFTIHASNMLAPNGRMAFVLPFEITYVKYSYPLWTYLGSNFGAVKIIRIHEDFFPDVDVETVLLLADQYGASTHCVDLRFTTGSMICLQTTYHAETKLRFPTLYTGKSRLPFQCSAKSREI